MSSQSVKRQFSRVFLDAVEPLLEANKAHFRFREQTKALLSIVEVEPDSQNFFDVRAEFDHTTHGRMVEYECRPSSAHSASASVGKVTVSGLTEALNQWFTEIKKLQKSSILDDQVLWGYEQEFTRDFQLADEDADSAPFNYQQQLFLDEYVDRVIEGLEAMRDSENGSSIDDLQRSAESVKEALTRESKNSIMRRLSRMWAKSRKHGLKYSKWAIGKFIEGLIKEGSGRVFNWTAENIHQLPYVTSSLKDFLP